ncbi:MAG: ATP-binding protein [Myxococcota bacterium]
MSRSQLQLMAATAALVAFVVAVTGLFAERGLRQRELVRIRESMEDRAKLVRTLVQGVRFEAGRMAELDAIVDRAQAAAGARITLIDRQGVVVADSNVSLQKLPSVENHAHRPEIRAALLGSPGTSERRSETVGRELFYYAIPVEGDGGGVVRLAVDLSAVGQAVGELRRELLLAGSVGLAAALACSYALSWLILRPLRELRRAAVSIAGGDLDSRLTLRAVDELGGISNAINQMASQIRQRLDETTREKEQLHAVLNGMVEGVLVIDADGRVLLVNARMRDFYDITGDEAGRAPIEVVRDAGVESLLVDAAQTDEPVSRRIEKIGADRRIFQVHAVRFPKSGLPRMGTVAVFHDITEVARLEAVRRDFVANASHELRTPVTAIRGFSETLQGSAPMSDVERDSCIDVINRHAIRLGNLVSDLLALSMIEAGQLATDPERVDVAALAQAVVRDATERFGERGLTVEVLALGPAVAWAHPQNVEQVLSNLIDNAINYTDAGGTVEVVVEAGPEAVSLRVRDTGIGIAPADQDRVFERFYRVDASRSRAVGGTGLGLSIVKHLVSSMGGEISLASEPGRGATFSVTLPAAPASAPA